MIRPRFTPLALLAAALLLPALGCVNFRQKYAAVVGYALDAGTPDAAGAPPLPQGVVLKIRPFRVAPMFENRKLVYRLKGPTWASDFYHEYFIDPAPMLTSLFQQWLSATEAGRVVHGSSFVPSTHLLEGNLLEIYGDYSKPDAPQAVLAIELLLLRDDGNAAPNILLHKTYRQAVPLAGGDAAEFITGLNTALRSTLTAFNKDLAAANPTP